MAGKRRNNVKQKRIQQVKRQIFMICVGICLVFCLVIKHRAEEKILFADEIRLKEATALQTMFQSAENGVKNADKDALKIHKVEQIREDAKKAGYPESVIELLDKNPETSRHSIRTNIRP